MFSYVLSAATEKQAEGKMVSLSVLWDRLVNWFDDVLLPYLPKLLLAFVVLGVGWVATSALSKIIMRIIQRFKIDQSVQLFIHSFLNITLKVIVVITFLAFLGINISAIIAAVGAAGAAIALALQNNLSNVASGLIILVTRPFKVGDFVEFEDMSGTVTDIQIMFTHLNTTDNKVIVIPNSNLTTNKVVNYSAEDKRRVDLNISISYNNDFEKAKSIIRTVVESCDMVYDDPAPVIRLGEHGQSALIIHVRAWCSADNYWDVFYDLTEGVKHSFDQNEIVIPYNQLEVHINKDSI